MTISGAVLMTDPENHHSPTLPVARSVEVIVSMGLDEFILTMLLKRKLEDWCTIHTVTSSKSKLEV